MGAIRVFHLRHPELEAYSAPQILLIYYLFPLTWDLVLRACLGPVTTPLGCLPTPLLFGVPFSAPVVPEVLSVGPHPPKLADSPTYLVTFFSLKGSVTLLLVQTPPSLLRLRFPPFCPTRGFHHLLFIRG